MSLEAHCRICEWSGETKSLGKHFKEAHHATDNEIRALYGWTFGAK